VVVPVSDNPTLKVADYDAGHLNAIAGTLAGLFGFLPLSVRFEAAAVALAYVHEHWTNPNCVGDPDCPAELHVPTCLGLYRTEEEVAAGFIPEWDELEKRRKNQDVLTRLGHGRTQP